MAGKPEARASLWEDLGQQHGRLVSVDMEWKWSFPAGQMWRPWPSSGGGGSFLVDLLKVGLEIQGCFPAVLPYAPPSRDQLCGHCFFIPGPGMEFPIAATQPPGFLSSAVDWDGPELHFLKKTFLIVQVKKHIAIFLCKK